MHDHSYIYSNRDPSAGSLEGTVSPEAAINSQSVCFNNCSGRGRCVDYACECDVGYDGDDCSFCELYCSTTPTVVLCQSCPVGCTQRGNHSAAISCCLLPALCFFCCMLYTSTGSIINRDNINNVPLDFTVIESCSACTKCLHRLYRGEERPAYSQRGRCKPDVEQFSRHSTRRQSHDCDCYPTVLPPLYPPGDRVSGSSF